MDKPPSISISRPPSPPLSPTDTSPTSSRRPSLQHHASSWSHFSSTWSLSGNPRTDESLPIANTSGIIDEPARQVAERGAKTRASLGTTSSRNISPKTSLSVPTTASYTTAKELQPWVPTPLTQAELDFDVPASVGLSQRLKELAIQTDSTVMEVLRKLSEAERHSALSKSAASKDELRDLFQRFMKFSEVDIEASFRLNLPIATWEHVADGIQMDGISKDRMPSAMYWRARHRKDRFDAYRETGRASR